LYDFNVIIFVKHVCCLKMCCINKVAKNVCLVLKHKSLFRKCFSWSVHSGDRNELFLYICNLETFE